MAQSQRQSAGNNDSFTTEEDIPEATLDEPLQNYTIPALCWWLLCHCIQAPTSWKKLKLIER